MYFLSWSRRLCRFVFAFTILLAGPLQAISSDGPPVVTVLVYHRFAQDAHGATTVRVTTFEAQLRFLAEHGYHIVPLREVVDWWRGAKTALPSKPVAITVDDGHRSVYDTLLPVVLQQRFPVTLFVYPSAISRASYALTWDQLRALKRSGWFDIQSHTFWHPNFTQERKRLSPAAFQRFARWQLEVSRQRIMAQTSSRVDMLAWSYGIHDDELEALAADAGYVAAFTLEARRAGHDENLFALPRMEMTDTDGPGELARMLGEPIPPGREGALP